MVLDIDSRDSGGGDLHFNISQDSGDDVPFSLEVNEQPNGWWWLVVVTRGNVSIYQRCAGHSSEHAHRSLIMRKVLDLMI